MPTAKVLPVVQGLHVAPDPPPVRKFPAGQVQTKPEPELVVENRALHEHAVVDLLALLVEPAGHAPHVKAAPSALVR